MLDNDSVMAKTVNGFKTRLEREQAKKTGLFLDWCLLDLEVVAEFRSSHPASILQVSEFQTKGPAKQNARWPYLSPTTRTRVTRRDPSQLMSGGWLQTYSKTYLKCWTKTVTGYISYHVSKTLRTNEKSKLEKSTFSMLFQKHIKMFNLQ